MALNFDTSACNPPEPRTPQEDKDLESIVENLVGIVRLRELTRENLDEWLHRIFSWDDLHESHWRIRVSRRGIRRKLQRWVGLKTNGVTDTREQWFAHQAKSPKVQAKILPFDD